MIFCSSESGSFTPKTPAAPSRDHGPFTRRSISVKELPRKALFQGSSQSSSSSSNYKTPDRSQEKISGEEHRPLDRYPNWNWKKLVKLKFELKSLMKLILISQIEIELIFCAQHKRWGGYYGAKHISPAGTKAESSLSFSSARKPWDAAATQSSILNNISLPKYIWGVFLELLINLAWWFRFLLFSTVYSLFVVSVWS